MRQVEDPVEWEWGAHMGSELAGLRQTWPMPEIPRPIVVIGAGGVVRDAHLPAYKKWNLPVAGIYDIDASRSGDLAEKFSIPTVFSDLQTALNGHQSVIFDIALPPQALSDVLPQLPQGAVALIQKPFGTDLADARRLAGVLAERNVTAAVNFQMRFTPSMVALSDAIARGLLGTIVELEIRIASRNPWEDWPFMRQLDHIEIPLHSIHYLDWIRAELGMPSGVYAKSVKHPDYPELSDTRTSMVLDYGDSLRCCLSLNHTHKWGPDHQAASLRIEGTKGAAIVGLGYLLDLPKGVPESLTMIHAGGEWETIALEGARMPDSFAAVMANLQRFVTGADSELPTGIPSSLETMDLVDACLRSNDSGLAVAISPG